MSEVSVVKSRAMVMLYNNNQKSWEPAGGVKASSYVQVYHHTGNNTFRIVGRSTTDPQMVLINSAIARNLKYNAATATFHQWRDQGQVYGLNFHSKDDAVLFKDAIDSALEELNIAASPKPTHTQQYIPQANKSWQSRYVSQSDGTNHAEEPVGIQTETRVQEPESPKTVSSSVSITPAAPPAPTPPSVPQPPAAPPVPPAAPPVPQAPPAPPGGGGVPAPPPPPPPPSAGGGGGGGGGGGLAAQIAAAKLKKSAEKPEPAKPSGPFGGDMMAEMQRKLAARKAKEGGEEPAPRAPQVDNKPDRTLSVSKTSAKVNHVPTPPNPAPVKPTTSLKQDSQRHNGSSSLSSSQLEEFKAEILSQFRKELDIAKAEIIQAMKQEISRIR